MVDIVDKVTRSKMMAGIRGKDTKPEVRLRRALHALGFRFRVHCRGLPGTPDIVLPKWNAVVEVYGCFWHRHVGCHLSATPEDRTGKWAAKFESNVARDVRNRRELRRLEWRVATVWECALRKFGEKDVAERLAEWLRSDEQILEIGV